MKLLFIAFISFFSISSFAQLENASGLAHLVFNNGQLHAHLTWLKGPVSPDESQMRLEWHDGATHALTEPQLPFSVQIFMPGMNHGSAPTQIQRVLDNKGHVITGTYNILNIYFMMSGDWELRLSLKYPNGSTETQVLKINVPLQ
jgi:hypothetical protein